MIPRTCQVLTICIAVLSAVNARADTCRDTLPVEDRALDQEEVEACLQPRAKARVALHLLGEREVKWSDYGSLLLKCVDGKEQKLSEDPIAWAVEASACPSPKKDCGCGAPEGTTDFGAKTTPYTSDNPKAPSAMVGMPYKPDNPKAPVMTGGTPFKPDNAEARSVLNANLRLIKREGVLATQKAKRECAEVEAALKAMPSAVVRKSCRSLR